MLASVLAEVTPARARAQAPATQPNPAVPAAPASPLDGTPIRELNVAGLEQITEAYVRNQIRTRAGQPYSQDQVQRDVGRLLRTGRFLDVRAESALVDGQVNLTFAVQEKPEVTSIEFVGNQKFKDKDLLEDLPFGVGDPLDLYDIRRGREAIEGKYREKGYAYAEVTFDEALLDERRVVYTIVENQRVRVRDIRFEGNVEYSEGDLKDQIATKEYFPIFRTGDFDPERAERDAATLQQFHRDRGFLDAEVSYVPEFTDVARERLTLTFRINEGTRYTIREVRFQGNNVFTDEELLAGMQQKPGEYIIQSRLETDRKDLETKYGSQGYIEVRVAPGWVFAEEPGQVILNMVIAEGDRFRVNWIEVNGNFHTQEKTVRRELRFYPMEIFDVTKLRGAERRLKETGLFTEATVQPVPPSEPPPPEAASTPPLPGFGPPPADDEAPLTALPAEPPTGWRDVLVTVEENPRTNEFIAGVGASSDNGIVGNIMLKNTNFDIKDWPRSWGEFFRGRAFRGAGQTAVIQLEPGTEFTRFRIDFREPYLFDMPVGFNTSFYLFERGRDGYDERRAGGTFSFDRRFDEGWLKDWTADIAFRAEYVVVADRDAFAARDIRDVDGGSYLSSVKLSLLHDTTDSRFDPGSGHRLRMAWEQAGAMGGDYYHSKLTGSYTQHFTLAVDEEDRKSVLSMHADAGQILGDAPVFERFYAGGIGSFRGFDFRGISPRDGLRKNRIGGDFMLLTGAEYSFPLFAKAVRGVTFIDMGTVERDFGINSWRAAIGAGVRLTLDIFGSVPMEFDLAYPISREDEDNERIFSFFIGLPFL
jgi:outer membrane protein insertion porin family